MIRRILPVLALLVLGCADAMSPDNTGTASLPPGAVFCPDAQDAQASANGQQPTFGTAGTAFDHTYYFHACTNPSGGQAYYGSLPCVVCGNLYDNGQPFSGATAILAGPPSYGACVEDTARSPGAPGLPASLLVYCVKPAVSSDLTTCDAASQGCY